MLNRHPCANTRRAIRPTIWPVCAVLLLVACDGGKDPIAPLPIGPVPAVIGRVTSSATGNPVAGALVRIGTAGVRTGADGRFRLIGLTKGAASLHCSSTGFVDFETAITVNSDSITHDIELTRIEVFEFGDFALYVPATVDVTRGLILALGGPDTRGFATGKPMGAPIPAVEASLQALAQQFRTLASTHNLAILGTSRSAMTNNSASDQLLLNALLEAGTISGHGELPNKPVLMYGMSGGAPQASGFAARYPGWVWGLFLKAPLGVSSVSDYALQVPTYMVLAERDAFVDNAVLTAAFESNRAAGGLWALAMELGVPHHSLSPAQREVTINWIRTIIELRPEVPGTAWLVLPDIAESSGWLGNRSTGEAAPFATYAGDRALASWLPSQAIAEEWETFVAPAASP